MYCITLHTLDKKSIVVPSNISFEGTDSAHTTIWWYDNDKTKHSAVVRESVEDIKKCIKDTIL